MRSGGKADTPASDLSRAISRRAGDPTSAPGEGGVQGPSSESTGAGPDGPRDRLVRLLDPIIYGGIFDYPVTLREIHRFCTLPMTLSQLELELGASENFERLVAVDGGYYFLKGQETLPDIRRRREGRATEAWRTARRVVNLIKYVPFVEGILASGSLAVNNVKRDDDLDFLMLIRAGRLWFVFFILGTMQRLFSRRYLCPNYYLSTEHLRLSRRTFYVAREAVQARPIYGASWCRGFREANDWVFDVFPNAGDTKEMTRDEQSGADDRSGSSSRLVGERRAPLVILTRCVEWVLGGRVGNLVEGILRKMLKHRLVAHYRSCGQDVPEDVLYNALQETELRFHGLNHEQLIYQAIETRRAELLARLDSGAGGEEPVGSVGHARDADEESTP